MKLSQYLIAAKMTATAFAEKHGIPQPTVHRYVHGERFPTPDMMRKIEIITKGKVRAQDWLETYKRMEKTDAN